MMAEKFHTWCTVFMGAVIISSLFGCASAVKYPETVEKLHAAYTNGMQKLAANDLPGAEKDFEQAVDLDEKSPMGYTGLAFVEQCRGNYKEALKLAGQAIAQDCGFADAYLARGSTVVRRRSGDAWFAEAMKSLETARRLDPENERTLFSLGEAYFEAQEFARAFEYYRRAGEKKGILEEEAGKRLIFTEKIMRFQPLPPEVFDCAHQKKINRADLCVLLIEHLKLKELLARKRPILFNKLFLENHTLRSRDVPTRREVDASPARDDIIDVLHIGVPYLDLFPDGNFYPDRIVTRALFAMVLQGVITIVQDDPSCATKYTDLESPFKDIHANYFAYNAIYLLCNLGIMETNQDGNFRRDDPVSGTDAVIMLGELGTFLDR